MEAKGFLENNRCFLVRRAYQPDVVQPQDHSSVVTVHTPLPPQLLIFFPAVSQVRHNTSTSGAYKAMLIKSHLLSHIVDIITLNTSCVNLVSVGTCCL